MQLNIKKLTNHWLYLIPFILPPQNNTEYDKLVDTLNILLDEVGNDESHPLMLLIDIISDNIANYDAEHFKLSENSIIDILKFLMQQHNLTQKDLPEIGSQGVVSEVLNGKRELNVRQIKKIAKRFNLSPEVFFD